MRPHLNLAQKGILIVVLPLLTQAVMYFELKEQLKQAQEQAEVQETSKKIVSEINVAILDSSRLFEALVMAAVESNPQTEKDLANLLAVAKRRVSRLTASLANQGHDKGEAELIDKLATQFFNQVTHSREGIATDQPLSIMLEFKASVHLRAAATKFCDELTKIAQTEENRQSGAGERVRKAREQFNQWLDLAGAVNACLAVALAIFFVRGTVSHLSILKENSRRLAGGQLLLKEIDSADEIAEVDKVFHEMAQALEQAQQKERKLIETLQASEERLQSVINSVPAALVVTDQTGKIESLNPTAERLFGFSSKQLVADNIEQLLNIKGGESSRSLLSRLLAETTAKPTAIEGRSALQEIIPLEVSVTTIETSSGKKLLVTMIDITERYKLELLKREFVAMVSHDIRAPLTSLRAIVGLVRGGGLGPINQDIDGKLALAEGNASHLLQMVAKLLDLEKLDSGLAELMFVDFKIENLFEAALNLVAQEATDNSLSVKTEAANLRGSGDIDSLVQVLTNLLSNAIRYSPTGSEIELTAQEKDGVILVQVVDHGPGIPPKKKVEIFERFKQSDLKRDKNLGFGLGLAICNAILKQHGQRIGVDSEEGQGSTFWFTIAKAADDSRLPVSSG
jgi:PAS domain S-box-containing protein